VRSINSTTRLRELIRKNKSNFLILNIGVVWILLIITSLNVPMATTSALFTSQLKIETTISIDIPFDNSALSFGSTGIEKNEIFAYIQNEGTGDMRLDSKYYIYYSPNGNPVSTHGETGELVSQGVIPKMAAKAVAIKLTYIPIKKGFYMFVAFQNHEKPIGKELIIEGTPVSVSKKINVN
jgi:YqxM protein